MNYTDALTAAMDLLAKADRVLFLGQGLRYPAHGMTRHFRNIRPERLIETPVCEEMQVGASIGLAMAGWLPVSVFPRWNFLLLAANQIVNHLDKLAQMTGATGPKVIIKVGVGAERPLFPGHQHVGDFSAAFRLLCPSLNIVQLPTPESVLPAYELALERTDGVSTILVEYGDLYDPPSKTPPK